MSSNKPTIERRAAEQTTKEQKHAGETTLRMWEDLTSPYSAKVRAFLNYKQIPWRRMRTSFEVYLQRIPELVGIPIIPVILTPDDEVLQDSTPIMTWLEGRHPTPPTIPSDPRLALLHWIVEDTADEYLPRFSMHYRWGNDLNRETLSCRIARRMTWDNHHADHKGLSEMTLSRQSGFDEHIGLNDATRPDLEKQLLELLEILEDHWCNHSYLFGERPSVADFALYGQLWAHLFNDPFPARIMEVNAPLTCHWLEEINELGDLRGEVGRTAFGDWLDLDTGVPDTIERLLAWCSETWLPWARVTAQASIAREKQCQTTIRGIETVITTHHYRAWSFEQVQRHYESLGDSARAWCDEFLHKTKILPGLMDDGILHNGLFDGLTPPIIRDGAADNRIKHLKQKAMG